MLEKTPRVRGQRVTSLLGPREMRFYVCTFVEHILDILLYICVVYIEYAHFLWI